MMLKHAMMSAYILGRWHHDTNSEYQLKPALAELDVTALYLFLRSGLSNCFRFRSYDFPVRRCGEKTVFIP